MIRTGFTVFTGKECSRAIPLLIGVLVFALYYRVLRVYFISDDFMLLRILADGLLPANILDHLTSNWLLLKTFGMYRPVSSLLFSLGYQVFGLNPFGYHLTAICLHIVNALLVIAFANAVTHHRNNQMGNAAGLLFAVHPLHANAVAWVSAFPTILSTFLVLVSLLAFLHFRETRSTRYYMLSLTAFFLALGSYEPAIVFPALLFGSDWLVHDGRMPARNVKTLGVEYAPYLLLVVAFFVARKVLFGSYFFETALVHYAGQLLERAGSYPHALRKLIYPLFSHDSTERLLRWFFFIWIAGYIAVSFRRWIGRESIVVALFVLFWAFFSTIVMEPVLEPVVGRYGYLASIGTCTGLAFLIVGPLASPGTGKAYLLPACLLVVVVLSHTRLLNQSIDTYVRAGNLTRSVQQQIVSLDSARKGQKTYFIGNLPWHLIEDGYKRSQLFRPGLSDSLRPPFTDRNIPIYPFIDFSTPEQVSPLIPGRDIVLLTWNRELERVHEVPRADPAGQGGSLLPNIEIAYPRDNARIEGSGEKLVLAFGGRVYGKFRLTFITPNWDPIIFVFPRSETVQSQQLIDIFGENGIPEPLERKRAGDDLVVYIPHSIIPHFFMDIESIYGDVLFWWVEALDDQDLVIARSNMGSFRVNP